LQIFAADDFKKEIKALQIAKGQLDLLDVFAEIIENDDSLHPILHFDQAIEGFREQLKDLTSDDKEKGKMPTFDERFFQCEEDIRKLQKEAVGCKMTCILCGRKCERSPHDMNEQYSHNCDTVGHQPRVFKGGHFVNWRGEKKPSHNMCDMIEKNKKVKMNGTDVTMA